MTKLSIYDWCVVYYFYYMDLQARLPSTEKTTNVLLCMLVGVDVDATKIMWSTNT